MNWLKGILQRRNLLLPRVKIRETDFLSSETELDYKIEDYYDRFLGEFCSEEIFDALDTFRVDHIGDLVEQGQLTWGQKHLFCLECYRSQILNGGFLQFMGNVGFLSTDVISSLQEVGLSSLAHDTAEMAEILRPHLQRIDEFPGDVRNSAFRAALRKTETDMKQEMLNSSAGKRLLEDGKFVPKLSVQLVTYIESHPEEFCSFKT